MSKKLSIYPKDRVMGKLYYCSDKCCMEVENKEHVGRLKEWTSTVAWLVTDVYGDKYTWDKQYTNNVVRQRVIELYFNAVAAFGITCGFYEFAAYWFSHLICMFMNEEKTNLVGEVPVPGMSDIAYMAREAGKPYPQATVADLHTSCRAAHDKIEKTLTKWKTILINNLEKMASYAIQDPVVCSEKGKLEAHLSENFKEIVSDYTSRMTIYMQDSLSPIESTTRRLEVQESNTGKLEA